MEKFLYCGDVERVLYLGSMDGCADLLLGIKHHNRFLCHGSVKKFQHHESVERVLHCGSIEDCVDPLFGIKHHNRFLCRDSLEKFLHRGYMEKVLHRGSIEDCADLLLGIKYHNDSYTVEAWKCYNERNASEDYSTVKVFKKDPLGAILIECVSTRENGVKTT